MFVLDDGFQHRRLHRDFDLVLINATEPFGFKHVHPRGLLREPLNGLQRADAIMITRFDEVDPARVKEIEREIQRHCPDMPIFHASHAPVQILDGDSRRGLADLANKRTFAFCAIGDPESFFRQVKKLAGELVGTQAFPDHHAYGETELSSLMALANKAEVMICTEKDWAKIASLPRTAMPLWRLEMAIQFREGDEARLLSRMVQSGLNGHLT